MTHPQTQDDEALVEVMAEAMAIHHVASWSSLADPFGCDPGTYDPLEKPWWRESARAALTALRNHEGRKG